MIRKIVLLAETIGLLFLGTACSAMRLAPEYPVGQYVPLALFPPGTSREEIVTKLGKPLRSRALPDGGRVDIYAYTNPFTYDSNDRLVDRGFPPPYGPPDDTVDSLSMNEIRERCRWETLGEPHDSRGGVTGGPPTDRKYLYDECFVRRLAIWGIE